MSQEHSKARLIEATFAQEFGDDAAVWLERFRPVLDLPKAGAARPGAELFLRAKHQQEKLVAFQSAITVAQKKLRDLDNSTMISIPVDEWTLALAAIQKESMGLLETLAKARSVLAPVGGRDVVAEMLVGSIAATFQQADEPITFGQTFSGEPSTRFGRLVAFFLHLHGLSANWRRLAQKFARNKSR